MKFNHDLLISDIQQKLKNLGNISLRKAAVDIGCSAATLSRVKRGTTPDLDTFALLCSWLSQSSNKYIISSNESLTEKPLEYIQYFSFYGHLFITKIGFNTHVSVNKFPQKPIMITTRLNIKHSAFQKVSEIYEPDNDILFIISTIEYHALCAKNYARQIEQSTASIQPSSNNIQAILKTIGFVEKPAV